ncbi:hydroxymethylbutenyl pyrophosphate reductase [Spirochaeta thermophila DSM 6578]|uniref:Hydroxymethylbutenyl pyrophosphate reductase n=1 Tax=Winmispira thermophila (strain ATCC 700085 / DSM 6578 / Z-1203) TaxID=869211 RepID=G0GCH8_WINT7|nr:4-hydroxy-3-methylbut-2-enyl diphosphate reductase [Spirochaeta thermophila]AEJ62044.1 hydroxymethylbutenyl pyrophosphate reductase [Spirochaeta thermophila DSM 6578]
MEILAPRFSGFCPGVKKAEDALLALRNGTDEPLYVLGELIHNHHFIEELERRRIHTVSRIEDIPEGAHVVIRTHGIPREVEERLRERFRVTDLTCFKVKALQKVILDHDRAGYAVLISGKRKHPEVQGLVSYARKVWVLETSEEIESFFRDVKEDPTHPLHPPQPVLLVSQTTAPHSLFEALTTSARTHLPRHTLAVHNSICPITTHREEAALVLQDQVDLTLVIGDPSSSNATKLYERLKAHNPATWFITSVDDLPALHPHLRRATRIQLVSSSSSPPSQEHAIRTYLLTHYGTTPSWSD